MTKTNLDSKILKDLIVKKAPYIILLCVIAFFIYKLVTGNISLFTQKDVEVTTIPKNYEEVTTIPKDYEEVTTIPKNYEEVTTIPKEPEPNTVVRKIKDLFNLF